MWSEIRDRHLEALDQTNGLLYFEDFSTDQTPSTPDIRYELESISDLSAFERVYPAADQDLCHLF